METRHPGQMQKPIFGGAAGNPRFNRDCLITWQKQQKCNPILWCYDVCVSGGGAINVGLQRTANRSYR